MEVKILTDKKNALDKLYTALDLSRKTDAIPEIHNALYGTEFCETTIVTCTKKFADENPEKVQKFRKKAGISA